MDSYPPLDRDDAASVCDTGQSVNEMDVVNQWSSFVKCAVVDDEHDTKLMEPRLRISVVHGMTRTGTTGVGVGGAQHCVSTPMSRR